jgi:hypothetical protein
MMVQPPDPSNKLHAVRWLAMAVVTALALPAAAQGPPKNLDAPAAEAPEAADPEAETPDPAEPGGDVVQAESDTAPRDVVWILNVPAGDEVAATAPAVFTRILEGSKDQHTVAASAEQLAAWIEKNSVPLPDCLAGIAPCSNPRSVLLESLSADLLVMGTLKRSGPRWTLEVVLYGKDGRKAHNQVFQSGGVPVDGKAQTPDKSLETLCAEAVRVLFNATGTVKVVTTPEGASISIDGKAVGVSPVITELPVGDHKIEATLENHALAQATANVVAGRRTPVEMTLTARLATLTVDSTPVLADIYIDNVKKGTAGSPLQLPPGEYELELRADGYRNRTVHLVVSPEEMKVMSLQLEATRPKLPIAGLGEVSTEAIIARHYYARVAYRYASITTGLDKSTGAFNGMDFKLGDLLLDGVAAPEAQADFGYHGIHVEAGYNWEHWGVVAMGLTILASGDNTRGELVVDGAQRAVKLDDFERVEFKPGQLTFRYPYKNLFPQVQTGFGYFSESFNAEFDNQPDGLPGTVALERSGLFWHFSIEASYFFDTWWFAYATLGVERDLGHDDTETETLLGFGVGLTLENPLQDTGFAEPPREVSE